jgi:hypothetical protein
VLLGWQGGSFAGESSRAGDKRPPPDEQPNIAADGAVGNVWAEFDEILKRCNYVV